MTADTETAQHPPPTFGHRAYGVNLADIGEEGGYVAEGHIPLVRFAAACNHLGRSLGLCNATDSPDESLAEFSGAVRRAWAVPADPGGEWEWRIEWDGVTAETPGALPVTLFWP